MGDNWTLCKVEDALMLWANGLTIMCYVRNNNKGLKWTFRKSKDNTVIINERMAQDGEWFYCEQS